MLTRKFGLPQVVGMIIAGLLIGPAIIGQFGWDFRGLIAPAAGSAEMEVLHCFSQIGVVFILFSSGLETDFHELKRSVPPTVIAMWVLLFLSHSERLGALLFMEGFGNGSVTKTDERAFVGCILSATVSHNR